MVCSLRFLSDTELECSYMYSLDGGIIKSIYGMMCEKTNHKVCKLL